MERFLVTGSAGHLGEALARTLHHQGHQVVGLDILDSPLTTIIGSITDPTVVRRALEGVTHVLHAATLHKPHVGSHSRQDFVDTNVTGTLTLLEAAALASVRSVVFTSSTSAFGRAVTPAPGEPTAWITEDLAELAVDAPAVVARLFPDLTQIYRRHGWRMFPTIDRVYVNAC